MEDYKELPRSKTVKITVGEKIATSEYDLTIKKLIETMNKWDKSNILKLVEDVKEIETLALWSDIKFVISTCGTS